MVFYICMLEDLIQLTGPVMAKSGVKVHEPRIPTGLLDMKKNRLIWESKLPKISKPKPLFSKIFCDVGNISSGLPYA